MLNFSVAVIGVETLDFKMAEKAPVEKGRKLEGKLF